MFFYLKFIKPLLRLLELNHHDFAVTKEKSVRAPAPTDVLHFANKPTVILGPLDNFIFFVCL
jgi:hypothetical protein